MIEGQISDLSVLNETQFLAVLQGTVRNYLRFKKACDIAVQLLKDNCHDFYVSIDSSINDSLYNRVMKDANNRNISVDLSVFDSNCSLEDVVHILKEMCGLELFWLDENRAFLEEGSNTAYLDEEESTVKFYGSLISGLSEDQILSAKKNLDDRFYLGL